MKRIGCPQSSVLGDAVHLAQRLPRAVALGLWLIIAVPSTAYGCRGTAMNALAVTPIPTAMSVESVRAAAPTANSAAPTAPTDTTTIWPALTPSPEPTPTVIPTVVPDALSGWLVLADRTGILQKSLADEKTEYLMRPDADWIEWGARSSTDRTQVAYWVQYADRGEIWLTSLDKWQPELALSVEEPIELDTDWAVGDRYLLGRQFFFEETGLLDEYKIARTYVIDVETGGLVTGEYWPGGCTTLAPSPRTGYVALWCTPLDMDGAVTYLVLEPEADPWLSEQAPDTLIDNCLLQPVCAWSPDGNYLAYVVDESDPDQLYYTLVYNFAPVHLADEGTDFIAWLRWSPHGQWLHYSGIGDCAENRSSCLIVMSVQDGRLVWRADNNLAANSGSELWFVEHGYWLSDQHMAFYGTDSVFDDGRVLIMDIVLGREVGYIDIGEGFVWDMMWVEQPVRK